LVFQPSCYTNWLILSHAIYAQVKQLVILVTLICVYLHMNERNNKCIAIVEDDPSTLDVLKLIIENFGFEVVTAKDRKEFDLIVGQPDLFLLDNWIAGSYGHDICIELKRNASTASIPVILLSAASNLDAIANNCGADIFMNKPFDIDELEQNIQRLLA